MPTPTFLTGFEHNLAPSTVGLWSSVVGSPTVQPGARTGGPGSYILRCAPVAAFEYVQRSLSNHTTHVARFYWRFTGSLPATRSTIYSVRGTVDLDKIGLTLQAGGNLVASVYDDSGSTYGEFGAFAVSASTWYLIDFRTVLSPGTSHTLSWQVNEVAQTGGTFSTGVGMTNYQSASYGVWENTTVTYEYDDAIISATNGDYPIGEGGSVGIYVSQALPAEHQSITLADWTYCDAIPAAGTAFASQTETDSRSRINNWTTTTGINVSGAGDRAGFTRWPMATAAFTSAPNGVYGYAYYFQASAGSNQITWRISLGTASTTTIVSDAAFSTSPLIGQSILTRPGGGSWAASDYDDIKFEGDSTDAAPSIYLVGMILEIDAPPDAPVGSDPVPFPPQIYGRGAA